MKNAIGAGMLPLTMLALVTLARAQQPPAPCHPNRTADMDMATVRDRGDVRHLPGPLRDRLVQLAGGPHNPPPTQAPPQAPFPKPPLKPQPSQPLHYLPPDTTRF